MYYYGLYLRKIGDRLFNLQVWTNLLRGLHERQKWDLVATVAGDIEFRFQKYPKERPMITHSRPLQWLLQGHLDSIQLRTDVETIDKTIDTDPTTSTT